MQRDTILSQPTPKNQEQTTMNRRRFLSALGLMAGLSVLPAPAPAEAASPTALAEWRDLLAARAEFARKYPQRFAVIERWEDYFNNLAHVLGEFTSEVYEASIQDPAAVDAFTLYDWSHKLKDAIDQAAAVMETNEYGELFEAATGRNEMICCIEWYIRQDPTKEWQDEIDYLRDSYPEDAKRLQAILDTALAGAK